MATISDVQRELIGLLDEMLLKAKEIIQQELRDQGHKNTGSLINDITIKVERTGNLLRGIIYLNDYFDFVNNPMPASSASFKQVPFLQKFFQRLGLSAEEAKQAGFATVNKWKKEGRPTRASFRFSKNGRRTGFADYAFNSIVEELGKLFEDRSTNIAQASVFNAFNRAFSVK